MLISLLKDIKAYKMKKSINNKANIYVKSFSGATVEDMNSYVLPSKKHNPDIVILHCGTNDLRKPDHPKVIADNIVNLAESINSENTNVVISSLIARRDELDRKRAEVNNYLRENCNDRNMAFIDNDNIGNRTNLNKSGLHLNITGANLLSYNYLCHISEFLE